MSYAAQPLTDIPLSPMSLASATPVLTIVPSAQPLTDMPLAPILPVIVLKKSASSPTAAASSFNVSRVAGALSMRFAIVPQAQPLTAMPLSPMSLASAVPVPIIVAFAQPLIALPLV